MHDARAIGSLTPLSSLKNRLMGQDWNHSLYSIAVGMGIWQGSRSMIHASGDTSMFVALRGVDRVKVVSIPGVKEQIFSGGHR